MNREPFRFKQFQINHDRSTMKVGTDGVLLGAWADLENSNSILDIGTGSGLIALMAAQRNPSAEIEAVEIDSPSCLQANENISRSKWKDRIRIYNVGIQDFDPGKRYETIISNPPFFGKGIKSNNPERNKARNSGFLTQQDLLEAIDRLMFPEGSFSLIYPYKEGSILIELFEKFGLYLADKMIVRSRKEMKPERLLLKFTRTNCILQTNELIIYESNNNQKQYTFDYISLTKDFYL